MAGAANPFGRRGFWGRDRLLRISFSKLQQQQRFRNQGGAPHQAEGGREIEANDEDETAGSVQLKSFTKYHTVKLNVNKFFSGRKG